jgi:hypothetical protein
VLAVSGPGTVEEYATYALTLAAAPAIVTGWTIDWGDGVIDHVGGTAESAQHVYVGAPMVATIRVSATDSYGTWNAEDLAVEVTPVSLIASISGPATVDEGTEYALALSASVDGVVTSWTIDWGDGSPPETVAGDPESVTHIYGDGPADHAIAANATNGTGTWIAEPVQVEVQDVPGSVSISLPELVREQNPVTVEFALDDPGDDPASAWSVDWGDGSDPVLLPGSDTSASHSFVGGGTTRTVTVTATTEEGDVAAMASIEVLPGPEVAISGAARALTGAAYTVQLSAQPGDVVTAWTIDWGDGATTTVAGSATEASHVYELAGVRLIRVTATDGFGTWNADDLAVTVTTFAAAIAHGHISAIANGNEVALFGRNSHGALWLRETAGGQWQPWTMVAAGGLASRPEAVAANGRVYVFYRGVANDLRYWLHEGGAWSDHSLGGGIQRTPAAAVDAEGNITVVVLSPTGESWTLRYDGAAGLWGPWERLGGTLASDLAIAAHGTDVTFVGLNAEGATWARTWSLATQAWGPWTGLGGGLASRHTVIEHGGVLFSFGLNAAGEPWYRSFDGEAWGPWVALGGRISGHAALAIHQGTLVFAVVNAEGHPWQRLYDGTWQPWVALGGGLGTSMELAATGAGVFAFGLSPDGALWYRLWDGTAWGPWVSLGGVLAAE